MFDAACGCAQRRRFDAGFFCAVVDHNELTLVLHYARLHMRVVRHSDALVVADNEVHLRRHEGKSPRSLALLNARLFVKNNLISKRY
jgi:hypothetical protein